ncbi:MAG: TIGR03086 family metal-binding protein [Streptosporangiaceae bacterium]
MTTDFGEIGRLALATGGVVSLDARAVQASVAVTEKAGPGDWARPTPCGDWTLDQLLAHMTRQHDGFAAAAAGNGADPAAWRPRPPAADPVTEYVAAAGRVLAAFAADGVLDRDFALPEIDPAATFPAALAISFHFIDYVVHGWDVARTLGLDYQVEPDLLGVALAVGRAVPDDDRTRRRPGAAFAPPVSAPEGASPVDQVVAQLGRPPGWAADWSAG